MATVLFDDECGKCSRWARFIQKRDSQSRVNLVGQNSSEGKYLISSIPERLEGIDSVFLISTGGNWYSKSAAIWRICKLLRFPWPIASLMFIVPWPIRDAVYDAYSRFRK